MTGTLTMERARRLRRRMLIALVPAALLALALSDLAAAAGPTCSEEMGIAVHGQHIIGDYVMGTGLGDWPPSGEVGATVAGNGVAVAGGPGPGFHFPNGFAPGASFCHGQSRSPGFHFP